MCVFSFGHCVHLKWYIKGCVLLQSDYENIHTDLSISYNVGAHTLRHLTAPDRWMVFNSEQEPCSAPRWENTFFLHFWRRHTSWNSCQFMFGGLQSLLSSLACFFLSFFRKQPCTDCFFFFRWAQNIVIQSFSRCPHELLNHCIGVYFDPQ